MSDDSAASAATATASEEDRMAAEWAAALEDSKAAPAAQVLRHELTAELAETAAVPAAFASLAPTALAANAAPRRPPSTKTSTEFRRSFRAAAFRNRFHQTCAHRQIKRRHPEQRETAGVRR